MFGIRYLLNFFYLIVTISKLLVNCSPTDKLHFCRKNVTMAPNSCLLSTSKADGRLSHIVRYLCKDKI